MNTSVHMELFCVLEQFIPALSKHTYPIVMNWEKAIVDAISTVFPNLRQLSCWRHQHTDVKHWVHQHG